MITLSPDAMLGACFFLTRPPLSGVSVNNPAFMAG